MVVGGADGDAGVPGGRPGGGPLLWDVEVLGAFGVIAPDGVLGGGGAAAGLVAEPPVADCLVPAQEAVLRHRAGCRPLWAFPPRARVARLALFAEPAAELRRVEQSAWWMAEEPGFARVR